ncbi:hypothetical protein PBI_PEREGRIN_54 [Rhodococcus phage Peregrin]|nr:hypothetical protein PBI_PEREGRIN_54 [Rhodococcus phage Peregrin]
MIRILFTGHGDHSRPDLVWGTIDHFMSNIADQSFNKYVFIHGNCPDRDGRLSSVDQIADRYAKNKGIIVEVHNPCHRIYGDRSFAVRNQQMVDSGAHFCLAFPDGESPGTWQTVAMARKAKIHTRVFELTESIDDLITG